MFYTGLLSSTPSYLSLPTAKPQWKMRNMNMVRMETSPWYTAMKWASSTARIDPWDRACESELSSIWLSLEFFISLWVLYIYFFSVAYTYICLYVWVRGCVCVCVNVCEWDDFHCLHWPSDIYIVENLVDVVATQMVRGTARGRDGERCMLVCGDAQFGIKGDMGREKWIKCEGCTYAHACTSLAYTYIHTHTLSLSLSLSLSLWNSFSSSAALFSSVSTTLRLDHSKCSIFDMRTRQWSIH